MGPLGGIRLLEDISPLREIGPLRGIRPLGGIVIHTCMSMVRSSTRMKDAPNARASSLDGRKSWFSRSHCITSVLITVTTMNDIEPEEQAGMSKHRA